MKNIVQICVALLIAAAKLSAQNTDIIACSNFRCDGSPVANVTYSLSVHFADTVITYLDSIPDSNGCVIFPEWTISGSNTHILTPSKDGDPLNGVNAFDLILIARHILGLQPLSSPYAMIAADLNKSGSITTFDVVQGRQLILGILTDFPDNTSWRFVYEDYQFPIPQNPFFELFPEYVENGAPFTPVGFVGIKVGDVDCTAYPGFGSQNVKDRTTTKLTLPDATLRPGETLDIPLRMSESGEWLGLQWGLRYDPDLLEVEAVVPGNLPGMNESAIASPQPGMLNVVWFDAMPQVILADENLLTLRVRALAPVRLSEAISIAKEKISPEAYTASEQAQQLQLEFTERSAAGGETIAFAPQPNPTSAGAAIPLRLAQTETVILELTDISGKRLFFQQITLGAGAHLLDIPATALPQTGVYVWRVQAGKWEENGRLVKM